jgi:hypothetical protein
VCYCVAAMHSLAATVLCFVAFVVPGKPNEATRDNQYTAYVLGWATSPFVNDGTSQTQGAHNDAPKWYASLKRPEWWLVVAGFLTLAALWKQAKEMRKATEAMRDNTRVLTESQRPRVTAKAHGNPTQMLAVAGQPRVEMELSNTGPTPAYDFTYETWIELLPFPFEDFTSGADHFKSGETLVLYPKHQPLIINIPLRTGMTPQQLIDLRKVRIFACIRIRVQYQDRFSREPSYTNFGFWVQTDGLGFLPRYND